MGDVFEREVEKCIQQEKERVAVSVTVSPFGCVPVGVREADLGEREANDPAGHADGRVRRQANCDLPQQVVRPSDVVVRGQAVQVLYFVVYELGHPDEVTRDVDWDDDVLRLQLEELVVPFQGFALAVGLVAQPYQGLYVGFDVAGPEVSQRGIGHVDSQGPILVDENLMPASDDALLERLRRLRDAHESPYALHRLRRVERDLRPHGVEFGA